MSDHTSFRPGDRVRFNAAGVRLFGGADQTGLVISMTGSTAQVAWESGQDTTATINTLERVPEKSVAIVYYDVRPELEAAKADAWEAALHHVQPLLSPAEHRAAQQDNPYI